MLDASDSHLGYGLEFHAVHDSGERVVDTEDETIDAVALDHRITSFGWCIRESERPGEFYPDKAVALGVEPGPEFQRLRNGETVEGSAGQVHPGQVIGPSRAGRTVVIAGDNRDPERLLLQTGPVQLLIHEATFTETVLEHLGDDRGHSTAQRVGTAAERHTVDNLILTHFSPRYGPSGSGKSSVDELRAEAAEKYSGTLHLASDYDRYDFSVEGEFLKA